MCVGAMYLGGRHLFACGSSESERGQDSGLPELGNCVAEGTRFQSEEAGGEREGSARQWNFAGPCGAVSAGRGQAVSDWGSGSLIAAWTSGLHSEPAWSFTHLWGPQEKGEDFWIWVSATAPQGSAGRGAGRRGGS